HRSAGAPWQSCRVMEESSKATRLSERTLQWAQTMAGHVGVAPGEHDPGVVHAHRDSAAAVDPGAPVHDRLAREAEEAATYRAGATLARGAGRRAVEEEPDNERTCFERDRDRIVHS